MSTKEQVLCRCRCGGEHLVRAATIIAGESHGCRSCASKLKALNIPVGQRIINAKKAASVAVIVAAARAAGNSYLKTYRGEYPRLCKLGACIRQRCTNPNSIGYSNYGGRGIQFGFASVRAFAEWVLDNIGPRPDEAYSVDRIDNNRGYEPGNLRWATRSEQARNKRAYRRTKNGERIRRLKAHRPDLTYETLRLWIIRGATDEEILRRAKYACTSI